MFLTITVCVNFGSLQHEISYFVLIIYSVRQIQSELHILSALCEGYVHYFPQNNCVLIIQNCINLRLASLLQRTTFFFLRSDLRSDIHLQNYAIFFHAPFRNSSFHLISRLDKCGNRSFHGSPLECIYKEPRCSAGSFFIDFVYKWMLVTSTTISKTPMIRKMRPTKVSKFTYPLRRC